MNSWSKQPDTFENMFHFLHPNPNDPLIKATRTNSTMEIPEEIQETLSAWALLYDIPFQYMVVREEMLPMENIRFFYVDYDYLFAMLDGALSLGRSFDIDYQHDAEVIDAIITDVLKTRYTIRPKLQGKSIKKLELDRAITEQYIETGFLLRSTLVHGWRGLEFKAFDSDNSELRALRLETLSSDVLVGIYQDKIHRLEIAQPPESLHFGFTHKNGGGYEKRLRNLQTGELFPNSDYSIDVTMQNEKLRVVNLAKTGENIKQKLNIDDLTSAHIAVEMIQNPATGTITQT